jgi:hypothetical protein
MKEIEQDLLSQSIETDSQTNELSRQSINESGNQSTNESGNNSINQSTNNSRLAKMSTVFKKSDETQPEVIRVSLNSFQDTLMKSLKWSETFDRKSKDIPGELIKVAESLGLGKVYLPLYWDLEEFGTNKPPVKEVAKTWKITQYTPEELAKFPTMTILGAYLGNQLTLFDIDGTTALTTLMLRLESVNEETLAAVKNTLWTSSDRQSRFGIWWKIPEKYQGVLKFKSINTKKASDTSDSEQLELRNGDHYQCLAGQHPETGMYWSNGKTPLEMPEELCELWLSLYRSDRKTSEEPKKAVEIDTTDFQLAAVQTLLTFLEALESDEIDTDDYHLWLRVGMILHSVDDTEKGLQIWDEWSQKSSKYQAGACEQKWASFSDDGDTLSIGSLYFWLQKESEKIPDPVDRSKFQEGIAQVRNALSKKWTIETAPGAVAEFKELGLTGQSLDLAHQRLALDVYGSASEHNLKLVRDLYDQEEVTEEDKQEAQNIIQSFRDLKNFELDARFIIGDTDLGKDFCEYYNNVGSIPGYEVVNFLPPVASCIRKHVLYLADQDQKAKPIIYVANLGTPGTGKNRVGGHYISPLEEVTKLDSQKHSAAKKKWEKDVAAWKLARKKGDASGKSAEEVRKIHWEDYLTKLNKFALDSDRDVTEETMLEFLLPEPPEPEIRALKEFTPEKAVDISANQKTWGTLACPDELSQIINGSKYSGGSKSGVDFSMMRNAWGGGLAQKLVLSEVREVDNFQMSMLTTGHPAKTFQWFDKDDCEGDLSRIIFCPVTKKIKFISNPDPNNPDGSFPMQKLIKCYDGIRNLFPFASAENPHVILPTIPAKALWIKFKDDTEALAEKLDHQGMQSRLYRTPEQVARIALILHCFYIQQGLFSEGDLIDVYTMERAISIGWASIKWAYIAYPGAISALAENNPDSDLIEFYSELLEKLQRSEGYELGQEIKLTSIRKYFRRNELFERFGSRGQTRITKTMLDKCLGALRNLGLVEYRETKGRGGSQTLVKLIK